MIHFFKLWMQLSPPADKSRRGIPRTCCPASSF